MRRARAGAPLAGLESGRLVDREHPAAANDTRSTNDRGKRESMRFILTPNSNHRVEQGKVEEGSLISESGARAGAPRTSVAPGPCSNRAISSASDLACAASS